MSTVHRPYGSNPLTRLYNEAKLPQAIRRSLSLILLGNLFGNLHGIICGGGTTAMIGLANQLQAGDFAFGLLNGIPQAAALLQIPFSLLVNRTHKRKKYLLTFGLFSRFLWLLFGFIPLVVPQEPAGLALWTLIFLLGISSCCSSAINVCWFPWLSDLAPISIRGRWFSIRDSVVAACNLLFGLLVARLLDTLPIESRYIIIFLIGGTVGMLDMLCFAFCEEVYSAPPQRMHFAGIVKDILQNKPFLRLVIMWTAWSILVISRWGKALDHYGCRSVMLVAAAANSFIDLFYLFSTPGNVVPVLLRNFVGAMCWSGTNLAANSMQLSASPDKARPSYIAVFACVTSLVGTTLGTLTGGLLLEGWQSAGWFTGAFDRFKALILVAVCCRLAVAAFLVPPLQNDREGTPKQLLQSVLNGLTHFNLFRKA